MARQNQGLEIALIILFMLLVVLGATTYFFQGRYSETLRVAKDHETAAAEARAVAAAKEAECAELKRMIGLADKTTGEINKQFEEDMKNFGAQVPENARFYSPILGALCDVINDKSKDVKALTVKLSDLDTRFKDREAAKDQAIAQLSGAVKASGDQVAKVTADYKSQRQVIEEDQAKLSEMLKRVRRETTAQVNQANEKAKVVEKVVEGERKIVAQQANIIKNFNRPNMDMPSGEIRWVNQRNSTVWINLGRADALDRQTTFSVFSADSTDLGKAVKKASIEVTRILGDHMAEARILDEKTTDPIMPGDKIFTPVWTPGEQIHFALAGDMDIDGDGRNALGTVRNLITMSGGVVDCEMDDHGRKVGAMTPQTRYLVLGTEPNPKSSPEKLKAFGEVLREAERLGTRKITLADLKLKLNYKKQATTERFGRTLSGATGAGASGGAPAPRPKPKAKASEE